MGNSTSGRSWPRDVRDLFRGGGSAAARSSRRQRDRDAAAGHGDRHRGVDDRRPDSVAATGDAAGRGGGATQRAGAGGGGGRTSYSKLNSCPDLQVVARPGDQQRRQRNDVDVQQPAPMKLNVKIYRSYRSRSTTVVLEEHVDYISHLA